MENPIFFIYLAVAVLVTSAIAIVIKRLLAVRGRKILSRKKLESFLASLSESYHKAHYQANTVVFSGEKIKKMRESIEKDLSLSFNYLFCNMTHFPKSFQKDYIDEEAGIFVDKMIPVLETLYQTTLVDKYSRPSISNLQKIFFDRMEIAMIHHLSQEEYGCRQIQIIIPSFARDFF